MNNETIITILALVQICYFHLICTVKQLQVVILHRLSRGVSLIPIFSHLMLTSQAQAQLQLLWSPLLYTILF